MGLHPSLWEGLVRLLLDMKIQANASGTRSIEITKEHLETLHKYSLLNGLIDSNGIVDEPVLDKLKLNIRSLLDSVGTSDKALLDLCFDVIYHKDMKALGLHNLILLYAEQLPLTRPSDTLSPSGEGEVCNNHSEEGFER